MHKNKGKAYRRQGKAPTMLNFIPISLLTLFVTHHVRGKERTVFFTSG